MFKTPVKKFLATTAIDSDAQAWKTLLSSLPQVELSTIASLLPNQNQ